MEYAIELPDDIQDQIEALSEQAEEARIQGRHEEALDLYTEALELLPEPREQFEAYSFLKATMGDICFLMDRFNDGLENFYDAYTAAGPQNMNPYIIYRLGQIYRQMGDEDNAVEFFKKTYLLEGEDAFEDESDLIFLKNRVDLDDVVDDDDNYGRYGYGDDDDDDDYRRSFDEMGFSRGYIPRDDYEEYGDD